jgi:hypothetical protein
LKAVIYFFSSQISLSLENPVFLIFDDDETMQRWKDAFRVLNPLCLFICFSPSLGLFFVEGMLLISPFLNSKHLLTVWGGGSQLLYRIHFRKLGDMTSSRQIGCSESTIQLQVRFASNFFMLQFDLLRNSFLSSTFSSLQGFHCDRIARQKNLFSIIFMALMR